MKNTKSKSIIRYELFGVLFVAVALISVYVFFFLNFHLKWFLENTAFEALGSEVNIESVSLSLKNKTLLLRKVQITDPDYPEQNIVEFQTLKTHFQTWPLIYGSFISDLSQIKNIRFHTQRKKAGRVLSKEQRVVVFSDPTKSKIHENFKSKLNESSIFSLIKGLSKKNLGQYTEDHLKKIKSFQISSEVESKIKSLKSKAKEIEDLKNSSELKNLLKEIKSFKPSEKSSLANAPRLISKIQKQKKSIKSQFSSFESLSESLKQDLSMLSKNLEKDISNVGAGLMNFNSLSPEELSSKMLSDYLSLQFEKVGRVQNRIKGKALGGYDKYVNVSDFKPNKKSNLSHGDIEKKKQKFFLKHGKTFIFVKEKIFPKYFFKKIELSSKASENQDIGDVDGQIQNLTSHMELYSQPLKVEFKGSAPKQGVGFFNIKGEVFPKHLKKGERFKVDLSDYLVKGLKLIQEEGHLLKILKSNSKTELSFSQTKDMMELNLDQVFKAPTYQVVSKDKNIKKVLGHLNKIGKDLNVNLKIHGGLKNPKIHIKSNLGNIFHTLLTSLFQAEIQEKSKIYKEKIQKELNKELGPYVSDIEKYDMSVQGVQSFLEDSLKKGLKKVEDQVKQSTQKKVKEKAKKALKDLFKKL